MRLASPVRLFLLLISCFLLTIAVVSCAGGGTDPISVQQTSARDGELSIDLGELDSVQDSPIIVVRATVPPTGASGPIEAYIRFGYRIGFEEEAEVKLMRAAAGTRNLNSSSEMVVIPTDGITVDFFWDALDDLGTTEDVFDRVVVRAGVLAAAADDPREAVCDVEPVITVNLGASIVCPTLPPRLDGRTLISGTAGEQYSENIQAFGGETPLRYQVLNESGQPNGTNLIPGTGLRLDESSGDITGRISNTAPELVVFNVRVVDDCGSSSDSESEGQATRGAQQFALAGGRFDHAEFIIPIDGGSTIECADVAPQISDLPAEFEGVLTGQLDVPFTDFQFSAIGGDGDLNWSAEELPAGLQIDTNGLLSGTPTVQGSFTATITVTDSCEAPQSDTLDVDFFIDCGLGPVRTAPSCEDFPCDLPNAFLDTQYAAQVDFTMVNGAGTIELTEGTLPEGMGLTTQATSATEISAMFIGTPGTVEQGGTTFTFTLVATDTCSNPQTLSEEFSIFLTPDTPACPEEPPSIDLAQDQNIDDATEGVPYSFFVGVGGGTGAVTLSVAQTNTPFDITIDDDGRTLLADPQIGDAGDYMLTLEATDSCPEGPRTASVMVNLTVLPDCPELSFDGMTVPDATIGDAYSESLPTLGGFGDLSFQLLSGALPFGLSLGTDGVISGTPDVEQAPGDFTFDVRVTDSCPTGAQSVDGSFTLTLLPPACADDLVILTKALTDPILGIDYTDVLDAQGGEPTYTWRIFSGTLPEGLVLNEDGTFGGFPINEEEIDQEFMITVEVADSCENPGPTTAQANFTITLQPCTDITIITETLPDPGFDVPYGEFIEVDDESIGNVFFNLVSGSFPGGINFDSAGGVISGTATNVEDIGLCFSFTIEAIRQCGKIQQTMDVRDYEITLQGDDGCRPIEILSNGLPDAVFGTNYAQSLVGNSDNGTWSLTPESDPLPIGLTLSPQGLISGIAGDPADIGVAFDITVQLADTCLLNPRMVTADFTLDVTAPTFCLGFDQIDETLPIAKVGLPYFHQLLPASTFETPFIWEAVNPTQIPKGMQFTRDGKFTGIAFDDGLIGTVVPIDIRVTNVCGDVDTAIVSIPFEGGNACGDAFGFANGDPNNVQDPVSGMPYSLRLMAFGGTAPYTFTVVSKGGLPAGLMLDAATGEISGVPTGMEEEFRVRVRVDDSCAPEPQADFFEFEHTIQLTDAAGCPPLPQAGTQFCVDLPEMTFDGTFTPLTVHFAHTGEKMWDTVEEPVSRLTMYLSFDAAVGLDPQSFAPGDIVPGGGNMQLIPEPLINSYRIEYFGDPIVQNGDLFTVDFIAPQNYGCENRIITSTFTGTTGDADYFPVMIQNDSTEVFPE